MNLLEEIRRFQAVVGLGFTPGSSGYEAYKRIARHFYQMGLKEGRRKK